MLCLRIIALCAVLASTVLRDMPATLARQGGAVSATETSPTVETHTSGSTWYIVLVCVLLAVVLVAWLCRRNRVALATLLMTLLLQLFGLAFLYPRHMGPQVCIADGEPTPLPNEAAMRHGKPFPTRDREEAAVPPTPMTSGPQRTVSFLQAWRRHHRARPSGRSAATAATSTPDAGPPKQGSAATWRTPRAQDPMPRLRRHVPSRAMTLEEHRLRMLAREQRRAERNERLAEREAPHLREFEEQQAAWRRAQVTRALVEPALPLTEAQRSMLHRVSMEKQQQAVRGPATFIGRIKAAAERRATRGKRTPSS